MIINKHNSKYELNFKLARKHHSILMHKWNEHFNTVWKKKVVGVEKIEIYICCSRWWR